MVLIFLNTSKKLHKKTNQLFCFSRSFITKLKIVIHLISDKIIALLVLKMKQLEQGIFILEFIRSPKTVGAICPCSKKLAYNVAEYVTFAKNEFVLEIGAGTGCITESLLSKGIHPSNLILIERSAALVAHLKNKFPNLTIIKGDAADLIDILPQTAKSNVGCIVSSIPMLSLPKDTVKAVINQIRSVLGNRGLFIQYTYGVNKKTLPFCDGFKASLTKIVWFNIPPARIIRFVPNEAYIN